jgi:DNA-binding transcriptional regulator YiaG
MPNIAKVLKDEIARISKHEAKIAVSKPLKSGIANKKALVDIKRRLIQIEKSLKGIQKAMEACRSGQAQVVEPEGKKEWLSGRGIKALRKKMRISQAQFAKLVKVSTAAVLRWEKQAGKLTIRGNKLADILALRGTGVREAQERLKGMGRKIG